MRHRRTSRRRGRAPRWRCWLSMQITSRCGDKPTVRSHCCNWLESAVQFVSRQWAQPFPRLASLNPVIERELDEF